MATPELKQFGDLTREDFDRHPVWIGCHTADYDEPWYDDTDEETFRPWTGDLPADAGGAMLLVRATIELRDGSRYPGFVTPAPTPGDLGTQQPQIFAGDRRFGFWGGMFGVPVEGRQALYAALGKPADAVFPLRFSADAGLAAGEASGEVLGFYRLSIRDRSVQIEV
jgi:peptidoglycan/xylan/chitin deacetylase (PgdA/CDA1 family)